MTTLSQSRRARRSPSLAAVIVLVAAGCGGGDSAGPHTRVPASSRVIAGDKQTGAAGSPLAQSIVIQVSDASGAPVPGVGVTFVVTGGDGAASPTTVTSDASGQATTQWTIGTKVGDTQQLTASVASTTSVPPLTITASVVAGPPSALDATSPVTARAGLALPPITVVVRDGFGNLTRATGIRVVPRLDAATGQSLAGALGVATDSTGALVTGLSITGRAGVVTLVFDADGMTSARVSVTLVGGAPVRTQATGNSSIDASAGTAGPPIAATPMDAWDNPVADADVAFAIDGVGVIGHATSGADGVATLSTWTAPALGSYRLTATAAGATSAQYSLTVHRPPPATLTPSPSNLGAGQAGSELVLDVKATDSFGNPVPDAFLTWSSGGGTKHGGGNTDNTGVAHLDVQLDTKVGTMQVLVQSGPTVSTTMSVQIRPAPFAKVAPVQQEVAAPAGTSVVIQFLATDFYDNPTPNQLLYSKRDFWTTGATITPSATTGSDGIAQFTVVTDPYAVKQAFGVVDSPATNGWFAYVNVTTSSTKGSVRFLNLGCSIPPNDGLETSVLARVFGTDGKAGAGVSVTFSVQPGNGFISPDGIQKLQATTAMSDAEGYVEPSWFVPNPAGTYKVSATAPVPYDGGSPALYFCHVG